MFIRFFQFDLLVFNIFHSFVISPIIFGKSIELLDSSLKDGNIPYLYKIIQGMVNKRLKKVKVKAIVRFIRFPAKFCFPISPRLYYLVKKNCVKFFY